jgi:magnesium-transporting ATPase (P-type)
VVCREVSAEEYAAWEPGFHLAKTALQDRDAQLDAAAELIEKDLLLLGATAIEDKLQEVGAARVTVRATVQCQARTE